MAGKGETRGGGLGGEEDRINLLAVVVAVIAVVVVVVLVMLRVRDWCNFQLCEKEVTTKGVGVKWAAAPATVNSE